MARTRSALRGCGRGRAQDRKLVQLEVFQTKPTRSYDAHDRRLIVWRPTWAHCVDATRSFNDICFAQFLLLGRARTSLRSFRPEPHSASSRPPCATAAVRWAPCGARIVAPSQCAYDARLGWVVDALTRARAASPCRLFLAPSRTRCRMLAFTVFFCYKLVDAQQSRTDIVPQACVHTQRTNG